MLHPGTVLPALALTTIPSAIRLRLLQRFHSATWLPPPRAGTLSLPAACGPSTASWEAVAPQGTAEHPWGIAHPDGRVPAPHKQCQESVGHAWLPCAAAQQLPQSYKEMPEPAATKSITHWGGTWGGEWPRTRDTWPEPGVTQLRVIGMARVREGGRACSSPELSCGVP